MVGEVVPPHADMRLYGAAAFERCLQVLPVPVKGTRLSVCVFTAPGIHSQKITRYISWWLCSGHLFYELWWCGALPGFSAFVQACDLCLCMSVGARSSKRLPRCWGSRPVRLPCPSTGSVRAAFVKGAGRLKREIHWCCTPDAWCDCCPLFSSPSMTPHALLGSPAGCLAWACQMLQAGQMLKVNQPVTSKTSKTHM